MPLPRPRSNIAKALARLSNIRTKRGNIEQVARSFSIPSPTLRTAGLKLRNARAAHPYDPSHRSILRAVHLAEALGATSHRLLTDDQEELVVLELRFNHPNGFNNTIIRQTCRSLFRDLRDNTRVYSRHFITSFKHRANIRR